MAKISIWDIKQELVVFLRNQDIISISDRGVTTSQDTGTFSADSSHTLATNPTLVKNVRNVEVASTDLVFGTDYTVNYTTGVIRFTSPQTGAYVIDYDQGSTDRICPDFPQPYLNISDFPRIAIDVIAGTTSEYALNADGTLSMYSASIVVYDADQSDVEEMIASVRTAILDNKKNLYYSTFITPTNLGPILVSPFGQNKIVQRNQDFKIDFIFEN